jgi:hypothetical protein
MVDITKAGDSFIWLTSLVGGLAMLFGAYRAGVAAVQTARASAILGRWYGYGYFETLEGPLFYREIISVTRRRWLPWLLRLQAKPVGSDDVTRCDGTISVSPPFVYVTCYEPVFGDRTYEIYRWKMGADHRPGLLIGIHLGRSYEEHIHSATAFIMTRSPLDPATSETRGADAAVEQTQFELMVQRHYRVDAKSLQLLME